MTIVGLEKRKSGACSLLVLDPMFKPSPGIRRLIGTSFRAMEPEKLLKAYRRGEDYLSRHSNFEFLRSDFSSLALSLPLDRFAGALELR